MKSKIIRGLDCLLCHDSYLLALNINERSITHKLAEHYQRLFPMWHVDCEYNKNLSGPKIIKISPEGILKRIIESLKKHQDNNDFDFLGEKFSVEDAMSLRDKLLDESNFLYDDDVNLTHFVLEMVGGKRIVKSIYPDIIIHHRGKKDNYIVIEVKKSSNTNKKSRLYDMVKLMTLVDALEYKYKQGIFIDLPTTKKDLIGFKRFGVHKTFHNKVHRVTFK